MEQPEASTSQSLVTNGVPTTVAAKPKLDKAARRALQEAQRAAKGQSATGSKPKPATQQSEMPASNGTPLPAAATPSRMPKQAPVPTVVEAPSDLLRRFFTHLDGERRLPKHDREREIHPAISRLALQYSAFKIVGANARCLAMLEAFKEVIRSYSTPSGTSLTRHLPTHLSPQINHLVHARPMAVSMGNAIRYLKWEITNLPPDIEDDEAKEHLCEAIDHFIRDRIVMADRVIEAYGVSKINNGDTVLTYARSSVVEGILLSAKQQGRTFRTVVIDSRPMLEGRHLMRSLCAAGIPTTYALLPALGPALRDVNLVLLGTHALLSDGAMFARAGTATVAMLAHASGIPVACCCETYKFSDRVMLDSIVGNEVAPPSARPAEDEEAGAGIAPSAHLTPLDLLYDVSRPDDLTVVISEAGLVPPRSTPSVLREFKPITSDG